VTAKQTLMQEIRRWEGTPISEPLASVVSFLIGRPNGDSLTFTYAALSQAAELYGEDSRFVAVLSVLVSSPRLHLLNVHYFLDDGESEIDLRDEDVAQAQSTGQLAHPSTGELIENYERLIYPYFEGSDLLRAARGDA
jgi:hypothetical protein